MIDTVLNLLFRCSHRRLSRPVSPASKKGVPQGPAYVVCLDCGKHFEYDTRQMRLGKRLENPETVPVSDPLEPKPKPPGRKLKFALWAGLPLMVLLGSFLKSRKPRAVGPDHKPETKPEPQAEPGRGGAAPR
jgi:hypothetical protein